MRLPNPFSRRTTTQWRPGVRKIAATSVVVALVWTAAGLAPGAAGPFTATTSGPSNVYADAWTSYYTTVAADPAPAGWWKLNDAANPITAAAGTVTGACNQVGNNKGCDVRQASWLSPAETGGYSILFNASQSGRITMSDTAAFGYSGNQVFSAELWFKYGTQTTNNPGLISKKDSTGGWFIGVNGQAHSTNPNSMYAARMDSSGADYLGTSSNTLTTGQNYHVVLTYDGSTLSFYFNGVLASTLASPRSIPSHTTALALASMDGGNFFQGQIDEVAVYGVALTARQVRAHYFAGS